MRSPFIYVGLLLLAMVSIQCSASMAKYLFTLIGPTATTALRLSFSCLFLLVAVRPWRHPVPPGSRLPVLLYGFALGVMNLTFYQALSRIPLGIAVALEFSGPLAVAMFSSRKPLDFLWVGLALAGLLTLLPLREESALDPVGVAFALVAGVCWAIYIVFGKKAGAVNGVTAVSFGTMVAAVFVLPIGFMSEGSAMLKPEFLPYALLLGLFSSALPYSLEMMALPKLPAHTFGTLMSLEPAVAALSGAIILHENLAFSQWLALGAIITASIGSTLTIRKA